MSYIWGGNSPTSGNVGDLPSDLRRSADRPHAAAHGGTARVVPDLYRRTLRDERRQAGAR